MALRALLNPLRARVRGRCSGARPAQNSFIETTSRAWPRTMKFIATASWFLVLDHVALERRQIFGCGPGFEP